MSHQSFQSQQRSHRSRRFSLFFHYLSGILVKKKIGFILLLLLREATFCTEKSRLSAGVHFFWDIVFDMGSIKIF